MLARLRGLKQHDTTKRVFMSHISDEKAAREKKELARKLQLVEKEARRKAITERKKIKGLQVEPTAAFYDDAEKREPGDRNIKGFGFDIHP
ncbi:hypothetical protein SCARR_05087 [Pontiella sulfatireligans]|uniref:Uncharacterized protein n=2 Tax=Pontiella sulfatireligans TaxID=2750658 RepID=A0A6C2URV6_9BACT|nr:hypothetical protein SCARR_05087 [Pontiella sulfatireligans]